MRIDYGNAICSPDNRRDIEALTNTLRANVWLREHCSIIRKGTEVGIHQRALD